MKAKISLHKFYNCVRLRRIKNVVNYSKKVCCAPQAKNLWSIRW